MKQSTSLQNIHLQSMKTMDFTKNIAIKASDFSTYLSLFLANSRAKDKLLSLLQYIFDFIYTCGRNSNIKPLHQAVKNKQLIDMLIYYNLKQNISSARKVFRLFRFFDEIKGLAKIIKTNRPILFKILSVFTYFCSCLYYLCDNTLWLVGIFHKSGLVDKEMKKKLKKGKNSFSLFRIIAYLIILFYSVALDSWELRQIEKQLAETRKSQKSLDEKQPPFTLLQVQMGKKIIQYRRRIRFYYLETSISILRFIMLTSSLKLKYHTWLDPIFVAFCGLLSSNLNFTKTIFQKKIIMKVDKGGMNRQFGSSLIFGTRNFLQS